MGHTVHGYTTIAIGVPMASASCLVDVPPLKTQAPKKLNLYYFFRSMLIANRFTPADLTASMTAITRP
jgi:hypothetical protein